MPSLALTAPASGSPPFAVANWQAAALEKREEMFNSIPESYRLPDALREQAQSDEGLRPEDPKVLGCGILTDRDLEITLIEDVPVLLERIANRTYSAVEVAKAFCKRAAIAQQCTGCLTELMYERAIQRAQYLDDYLETEGKTVGLLHGLPVSLKVRSYKKIFLPSSGLVPPWPFHSQRLTPWTRIVSTLKVSTPMLGWFHGCHIELRETPV